MTTLKIVHLEDDARDAELVAALLSESGLSCEIAVVRTGKDFQRALETFQPGLIFSDFTIPGYNGGAALELARRLCPDVPFIYVSGTIGEDAAIESLLAGATDYVLKNNLRRLGPAVRRATAEAENRLRRRQAEEELRRSHKTLEDIKRALDNSAHVAITDEAGLITYVNDQFCSRSKFSRAELMGADHRVVNSGFHPKAFFRELWETIKSGKVWRGDVRNRAKDGTIFWQGTTITPFLDSEGQPYQYVAISHDITRRKQALEDLQTTQNYHALALDAAQQGMWTWELDGNAVSWTPLCRRLLGIPAAEEPSYERFLAAIHPEDREELTQVLEKTLVEKGRFDVKHRVVWPDGTVRWLRGIGKVFCDEHGRPLRMVGVTTDVTAERATEERLSLTEAQLRQAQKMESIGRLAGGVAHDFNNLLTVITGYTHFIRERLGPLDPIRADLEEIGNAAARAAALTRQLLAFSRQQVLRPQILEIDELIANLATMLRRMISEDVSFTFKPGGAGRIRADATQIEQILLNLCVNGKDAMPLGGRLTIRTQAVRLDSDGAKICPGLEPGRHVTIEVEDTGVGMSKEIMSRLFEPFFTTKEVGMGTGLGLATVYGIVKQSGGAIHASSEPGQGSTFSVFFPQVDDPVSAQTEPATEPLLGGTESLLLVEDDPGVRGFIERVLRGRGYRVLAIPDPQEALRRCQEEGLEFQLLLTDIVMPGLRGNELATRLRKLRPRMKAIFMSGYTDKQIADDVLAEGAPLLQKPVTAETLLRIVRQALDA